MINRTLSNQERATLWMIVLKGVKGHWLRPDAKKDPSINRLLSLGYIYLEIPPRTEFIKAHTTNLGILNTRGNWAYSISRERP